MKYQGALLSGCVFGLVLGYSDVCYGYASYSDYLASKNTSIEERQQQIIDQEPVVNRGRYRVSQRFVDRFTNRDDRPIDRVNDYYRSRRWTRGTWVDDVFDQESEEGFSYHSMMNTVPFGERRTEEGEYRCFLTCLLPFYYWYSEPGSKPYRDPVEDQQRDIVRRNNVRRFAGSGFYQFGE